MSSLDLNVLSILGGDRVIVGGVECKETYADFQPEMVMINRAFAEVMMEGDARGRVFTFPITTYNITPDFDRHDPNLDMLGFYGKILRIHLKNSER